MLAFCLPVREGMNITLDVQVAETDNVMPEHKSFCKVKSAEFVESDPIIRRESPVFLTVI